ncbi:MAG TPA: serine hydrolase domain-containing protein, partial [Gemmatimonadales bacterium]
ATAALPACACALAPQARAQSVTPVDTTALAAFVDSFVTARMAADRIPGAGFVFVQDGRAVVVRGYGLADVARMRPVVPDSTIWRIGSISKVFTATAVMQLVDRGAVKLDAPVDSYVSRVAIPRTYPEPVTVRQLLDHTAGFDEIRPGTQAPSRELLLSLDEFLKGRLARVRPPGRTTAYSTYGITLAGALVEDVSGETFEAFLRRSIWEPLGMRRASIHVPDSLRNDLAIGYEFAGDSLAAQRWEWYHTSPASSINATIADMARFIVAHLPPSRPAAARILSDSALAEMHRQQVTMHPSIPGYAVGFNEDYVGGLRVLEHGGNMAGFSALMVLVPSRNAGFFVVNQLEGSRLRDDLKWLLLERLFPEARERREVPSALPPAGEVKPERFAGTYIPLTSCFSCQPMRAGSSMTVTANADGTLGFAGGRWIAVDSLRFVRSNGTGYIVFRADSAGTIQELFAGAYWGWQKVQ